MFLKDKYNEERLYILGRQIFAWENVHIAYSLNTLTVKVFKCPYIVFVFNIV